jgi:hypothetical protein
MKRPDQDRFDLFAVPFERMDQALQAFALEKNFELNRNVNRQPGRVLRKRGNPHYLIDIALEQYWLKVEYRDDLPLAVTAVAYYEPEQPTENHLVYRIDKVVAQNETFSALLPKLHSYLNEALFAIEGWTPEVICRDGKSQENLRKKFGTGSLGDT